MVFRCARFVLSRPRADINLLLTEREGRTGGYWPEVVAAAARSVQNSPSEGQYTSVRLEQTKLVGSLLYGTRFS